MSCDFAMTFLLQWPERRRRFHSGPVRISVGGSAAVAHDRFTIPYSTTRWLLKVQILSSGRTEQAVVRRTQLGRKADVSTFCRWRRPEPNSKPRSRTSTKLVRTRASDIARPGTTPSPSPARPAGTLHRARVPPPSLSPRTNSKIQINPGLSLWLDERWGAGQRPSRQARRRSTQSPRRSGGCPKSQRFRT